jgi:uncharacterized membrane protein YkvA (DUF1232 family)
MSSLIDGARNWARGVKRDIVALWIAARDARTPIVAKVASACVAAYALSPVDLIPDFVPILGYLDDLLIVPIGILVAVKLIPALLMAEFRIEASRRESRPVSRVGLAAVVLVWSLCASLLGWWMWKALD